MSNLLPEEQPPRRIHIIGGPGSGKSTLARELGTSLGAPVYELDKLAFAGPDFAARPLRARLADARRIAAQPAWIAEGIFLGWTDDLLRAADLVVWLDHVGWLVAAWRIVTRFSRWGAAAARRERGRRKWTRFRDYARHLRQLAGVLRSSRAYYRGAGSDARLESRAATARCLAPYQDKVVHCRDAAAVRALIAGLAPQPGAAGLTERKCC